jgi:hypothetical protein
LGEEGGVSYLVTELLQGESLRERHRAPPVRERPVDPRPLDEYLKGRAYWSRCTEESVREALAHFLKRAIELDPLAPVPRYLRGTALELQGHREAAERAYRRAVRLATARSQGPFR